MKCPIDGSDLVMAERQGIEIDYCPKCRGVWLDRGELDKIIERAAADEAPRAAPAPAPAPQPNYAPPPQSAPYPGHYPKHGHYDPRYKKRKSLLGELFDFD